MCRDIYFGIQCTKWYKQTPCSREEPKRLPISDINTKMWTTPDGWEAHLCTVPPRPQSTTYLESFDHLQVWHGLDVPMFRIIEVFLGNEDSFPEEMLINENPVFLWNEHSVEKKGFNLINHSYVILCSSNFGCKTVNCGGCHAHIL